VSFAMVRTIASSGPRVSGSRAVADVTRAPCGMVRPFFLGVAGGDGWRRVGCHPLAIAGLSRAV
jgi:hypothetical protein